MDPNQTQQTTAPIATPQPVQTQVPAVSSPTPIQQPIPSTPPINTPESNKKMPLLLFVLFLLIVAIGGGVFYFLTLNKPTPPITSANIPSPTQVVTPTITPTDDEELQNITIEDPTTDSTIKEITDDLKDL